MAAVPTIGPLTLLGLFTPDDRPPRLRLEEAVGRLEGGRLEEPAATAGKKDLPGQPVADVRDTQNRLLGWVRHIGEKGGAPSLPAVVDAASLDERTRQAVSRARGVYLVGILPGGADPFSTVQRALRLGETLVQAIDAVVFDYVIGTPLTSVSLRELGKADPPAQIDRHVSAEWLPAKKGGGLWVHTHGMEKFAAPNLEAFDVAAGAAEAVARLLVLVGDELVLGEGPDLDGTLEVEAGILRLRPAEAVRGSASRRASCVRFRAPSLVAVDGKSGGPIDALARAQP